LGNRILFAGKDPIGLKVVLEMTGLGVTKKQSRNWQKLAGLDDSAFEKRVADAKREAVKSVEMSAAERAEDKKIRREEREAELAVKQAALPQKRYGVVYADPEWRFEPYSRGTGFPFTGKLDSR
jgi:hypothetical protein